MNKPRPNRDAILLAWFGPGTAVEVGIRFRTTTRRVQDIWHAGKARGDLPRIVRPAGGPRTAEARRTLRMQAYLARKAAAA